MGARNRPSRNRIVVPARQATFAWGIYSLESILGLLKSLKIRALIWTRTVEWGLQETPQAVGPFVVICSTKPTLPPVRTCSLSHVTQREESLRERERVRWWHFCRGGGGRWLEPCISNDGVMNMGSFFLYSFYTAQIYVHVHVKSVTAEWSITGSTTILLSYKEGLTVNEIKTGHSECPYYLTFLATRIR